MTCVLGPAHDAIGADGQSLSVRTAQWTVYDDANSAVLTAQGYASGTNWGTLTLVNPVSIIQCDGDGQPLETIAATWSGTVDDFLAANATSRAFHVLSAGRRTNTPNDLLADWHPGLSRHSRHRQRRGSSGANYDQTDFGYDDQGRRNRVQAPGGTITRTVYSARGQVASVWVGTDDTPLPAMVARESRHEHDGVTEPSFTTAAMPAATAT